MQPASAGVPGVVVRSGGHTYNWNVHCEEFVPRITRPTAIVSPVSYKTAATTTPIPTQTYGIMYDMNGQVSTALFILAHYHSFRTACITSHSIVCVECLSYLLFDLGSEDLHVM